MAIVKVRVKHSDRLIITNGMPSISSPTYALVVLVLIGLWLGSGVGIGLDIAIKTT